MQGQGDEFFERSKDNLFFTSGFDLSQIYVHIIGDLIALSWLYSQHPREVTGFIAANFRVAVSYLFNKEPSPHSNCTPLYPFSMIAYLRGALLEKHPNAVIVETNGIGYEVTIPVSAYSSLPDKGAEVRLHIHTHVREDALSLFGFVSSSDKALFEKLITVS